MSLVYTDIGEIVFKNSDTTLHNVITGKKRKKEMKDKKTLPTLEITSSYSNARSFAIEYIQNKFNVFPHIDIVKTEIPSDLLEEFNSIVINSLIEPTIHCTRYYDNDGIVREKPYLIYGDEYVFFNNTSIFQDFYSINKNRKIIEFTLEIYSISKEKSPISLINKIQDFAKKHAEITKASFNVIKQNGHGFDLMSLPLNHPEIPKALELHYNDDFIDIDNKIIEKLSKKEKGLILLHGIPGSGKTSYIKDIVKKIDRKFIFVPPNLTNILSAPSFIEFLMEQKNSVLVIEDCENVLKKRTSGVSQEMSNLLNITDGLLSDILNIAIICTFNSPLQEIDDALMRKGRLSLRYEFGLLSKEKVNNLLSLKGFKPVNKELSLADVLNYEEDTYVIERKSIGFV